MMRGDCSRSADPRVNETGLTVIELMIVIAILGILATVAMSAWHDYLVRAKVQEAADAADPHRSALGRACREGWLEGAGHEALELEAPSAWSGPYTTGIEAVGLGPATARITVTLLEVGGGIDDGEQLILSGSCTAGRFAWTAEGENIPGKYLPALP